MQKRVPNTNPQGYGSQTIPATSVQDIHQELDFSRNPRERRKSSETIMIIEKHKDYETEGILQSIDEQLQSCKSFQERQQIFYQLIRQSK